MTFRLELTEPAEDDFRDLLSFTLQIWGQEQMAIYRDKIDQALKTIEAAPHSGSKRHGLLVHHIGRHRIFYRIDGMTVYVLRILHDRMDAGRHLPGQG